jgi:hypothetical protein
MSRPRLALIAVNIVIFLVFAEVLALAVYWFDNGALFYVDHKEHALIAETARGELTADVLHPYFGPIHRPGVRQETNNVGFGSPYTFPYPRQNERQFLVGIFGGSVARRFCDQGAPALIAALRLEPRLANRDVVPLCFSHEGYKQPQQVLVLAYFLSLGQSYDAVVNIDGFNEVALGDMNAQRGRDISMPSPLHVDPIINLIDQTTLTPVKLGALARISRLKERLNSLTRMMERNGVAALNFALERYYRYTYNAYSIEVGRFAGLASERSDASPVLLTPPAKTRGEGTDVYADIATQWAAGSVLMRDILAARGALYVHVLQPNQYFTTRRFGAAEARVARNPAQPFKVSVERGYPALERHAAQLQRSERFADATTLFDHEDAAVYEDDCCHYTQRGNELMAAFVAAQIRRALAAEPPQENAYVPR